MSTLHKDATAQSQTECAELQPLYDLATSWGVQRQYEDVNSNVHRASVESLLAVLKVLGAPVDKRSDVPQALREWHASRAVHGLEHVNIAWDGRPGEIVAHLPTNLASSPFNWQIDLENGESISGSGHLSDLPDARRASQNARSSSAKVLPISQQLPLGYHQLTLEIENRRHESLIVAAPTRAYSPQGKGWERSWGVFAPLYSLRSEESWGAGDFAQLRALNEWATTLGAGFVATLPLLPAFMDEPYEISPYSPVSRLFWNEFYLNVSEIPEFAGSTEVQRVIESIEVLDEVRSLRTAPLIDYRRQMAIKRKVLEPLAQNLFSSDSVRRSAFERYVATNPRLDDYATFRAVGEFTRNPWSQWPERLRAGTVEPSDYCQDAKRYHMYVQWLAAGQLNAAARPVEGAGLYMDLPLGVHESGYDVWRERDSFAVGVAGGCPPDIVFPDGQNWGFVPLHPIGIRQTGYRYVRDYLRHQLSVAKVLRIDHMPGFHRMFWIPPGLPASDGVYVRYNSEELYALFCLESYRHKAMLVGEDLGTVPPEVPEAMARHNFHRMHVIQYELKPDPAFALPEPPAASLAMINTHDMAPFAGFWQGRDLEERRGAGLLADDKLEEERLSRSKLQASLCQFLQSKELLTEDANVDEVFRACLMHLRDGPARALLISLEDLWQEPNSQNVPSTSGDNPNWRRRMRYSLEEFSNNPCIKDLLDEINRGFNGIKEVG